MERCGELAEDPRPHGFEKIEHGFRIRFLSYRITYFIDDANGIVTVVRVAPDPGNP